MSERPIGFTRPMRDAIRDGRKTQTRRVFSRNTTKVELYQHCHDEFDIWREVWPGIDWQNAVAQDHPKFRTQALIVDSHTFSYRLWYRAKPGDRLWVREPWRLPARYDAMPPRSIVLLDGDSVWYDVDGVAPHGCYADSRYGRKRNALHTPRWAARTFLRVTDVRAQRLQEISEDDAAAEGARREFEVSIGEFVHSRKWNAETASTHKLGFKHIWDSINATRGYGWASNPWVWAISFEVE